MWDLIQDAGSDFPDRKETGQANRAEPCRVARHLDGIRVVVGLLRSKECSNSVSGPAQKSVPPLRGLLSPGRKIVVLQFCCRFAGDGGMRNSPIQFMIAGRPDEG